MLGLNRNRRPVELGPYPLEKLKRDASVTDAEAAHNPARQPAPHNGEGAPLVRAAVTYLEAYAEIREPEPFSKKAPVPDDLKVRTRDIKGAAYFVDASQAGICEIPKNAWLAGAADENTGHTHAVVILVEHADPIDADNPAADWVTGNEDLLATVKAAEIANDIAGHISSLGFRTRAHWAGTSEVDLNKLAVLAGLAVRDGKDGKDGRDGGFLNPYVGDKFALAVVTTDYALETDAPLDPKKAGGGKAKNLSYYLGLSGAVSGLERWRRRNRPSHLGPYPVESLKRVDKPTTHIFEDEVPRVPSRANMYVRTALGDLSDKARQEAARWSQKHPVSQGLVRPMWATKPLQEGQTAPKKTGGAGDARANTKALKALAHYMGAAVVGICEIPDYCWYSHDKHGDPITPYHKYALVVLIDQGHETFQGASGNDWISGSQSMRAYLKGAEVVGVMAEHIRQMGFPARSHTNLDSHVLHVPLVLHAGLGELSRIGETALNPFLGMRFKTSVLTTDIPLEPDRPIDFGLQTFCQNCLKCARECPCQAIPYGDKVIFNGYETWKPDSERCTLYRATNVNGSACGRCVKVCPLSKDTTWDGPPLHRLASWFGIKASIYATWAKPFMARAAAWLDDVLGQGNPVDAKKWWLDMEVIGRKSFKYNPENYVVWAEGANRPKIDPNMKVNKERNFAFYPAASLPPPDLMAPYPTDRKEGMDYAKKHESVPEALARRARGGKPPAWYTPSYVTGEYPQLEKGREKLKKMKAAREKAKAAQASQEKAG